LKVFIFGKKQLAVLLLLLLSVLLIFGLCFWQADTVLAQKTKKMLPVYCVDRGEEKICAISFDAAWGNDILRKIDKSVLALKNMDNVSGLINQ